MKYWIIFIICILLVSCRSGISSTNYFGTLSSKDIPDISLNAVPFKTNYLDDECVKCGTMSEPVFNYDIKYDTSSHYRVVVSGKVIFTKDTAPNNQYAMIDSVGIDNLIIWKEHSVRERYSSQASDNNDSDWNKAWEKCPIPSNILKKIRKDFFIRMKYRQYSFGNDMNINGITTSYLYLLY